MQWWLVEDYSSWHTFVSEYKRYLLVLIFTSQTHNSDFMGCDLNSPFLFDFLLLYMVAFCNNILLYGGVMMIDATIIGEYAQSLGSTHFWNTFLLMIYDILVIVFFQQFVLRKWNTFLEKYFLYHNHLQLAG